MKVLAIETSTRLAQVALYDSDSAAAFQQSVGPIGKDLIPAVEQTLRQAACRLNQVDQIVVNAGPGSFTGIRVGMTAAKTLCFAAGIRMSVIGSLELWAQIAAEQSAAVENFRSCGVLMDALRGEYFVERFHIEPPNNFQSVRPPDTIARNELASVLAECEWIVGCNVPPIDGTVKSLLPNDRAFTWIVPDAVALAKLVCRPSPAGEVADPARALPVYVRPSYADEKKSPSNSSAT